MGKSELINEIVHTRTEVSELFRHLIEARRRLSEGDILTAEEMLESLAARARRLLS